MDHSSENPPASRASRHAMLSAGPKVPERGLADQIQLRIHGLNMRLAPFLASILVVAAVLTTLLPRDGNATIPALPWCLLLVLVAVTSGVLSWHRRGAVTEEGRAPGAGADTVLLFVAAGLLGVGAANLVAPAGARLLSLLLLGVCVLALGGVAARPLRFLVFTVLVLAPSALRAVTEDPALALALVGLTFVLALTHLVVSLVIGAAYKGEVEQRARLSRLEFTTEALYADREMLHTESRTDPLTGLFNRRHLEETLQSEWNRCRRSSSPLSCVLLDIDYFKSYNDHYGHDGGDVCLRKVADVLGDSIRRAGDVVARFGGEEFMVLLPETGSSGAATVADVLKRAVADANLPHAKSAVSDRVSISLGVATLVPDGERIPAELMKAADLALYEAKRSGRNCVVMADAETLDSARLAARGMIG